MYAQSELIPRHDQSNRHTRRARRRYATLSSSIEPLELRVMLAASISGTIFEDLT